MALTGPAHSEINIINRSVVVGTGPLGLVGLSGPTEMGPINTPTLIGSLNEYLRVFGKLLTTSDFPLYVRRFLEAGGRCYVNRLGHYTDIADPATLVGVAATITLGTGGNTAVFTAKNIGTWANGVIVTATAAASGLAGKLDITFTFPNNSLANQVVRNIPATGMTTDQKAAFNVESQYINIGTTAGTLVAGTATLASGSQDVTAIVATDVVGDVASLTGWHAFDNTVDLVKLCAPSYADNDIDVGLGAYIGTRKKLIGVFRPPIGLTDSGAVDYREATGAYTGGVAIDEYRMVMIYGDLYAKNPVTLAPITISAVADVLACGSRRDNSDEDLYKSSAGPERGWIRNASGVVFNVGTEARQLNAANLVAHGISHVIQHETYGIRFWGDVTLTKTYVGTLLAQLTVVEFLTNLMAQLKPKIDFQLFNPNNPSSWAAVYRSVRAIMNVVETKGAVQGGENTGWVYQGDQDVTDVSQATATSPSDIAAQRYTPKLFVKPTDAMLYIGLDLVVDTTDVNYQMVLTQP